MVRCSECIHDFEMEHIDIIKRGRWQRYVYMCKKCGNIITIKGSLIPNVVRK